MTEGSYLVRQRVVEPLANSLARAQFWLQQEHCQRVIRVGRPVVERTLGLQDVAKLLWEVPAKATWTAIGRNRNLR